MHSVLPHISCVTVLPANALLTFKNVQNNFYPPFRRAFSSRVRHSQSLVNDFIDHTYSSKVDSGLFRPAATTAVRWTAVSTAQAVESSREHVTVHRVISPCAMSSAGHLPRACIDFCRDLTGSFQCHTDVSLEDNVIWLLTYFLYAYKFYYVPCSCAF